MIVGQVKIFKIKVSKNTILMISKSMQQQIEQGSVFYEQYDFKPSYNRVIHTTDLWQYKMLLLTINV